MIISLEHCWMKKIDLNLQMFVKKILCTFQNVSKENVGCFAQCQSSSACLESLIKQCFEKILNITEFEHHPYFCK